VTPAQGSKRSTGSKGSRIRYWLKRIVLGTVLGSAALLALAYVADYCVFRYRVSANRQPFGRFTVNSYYAVQQKNGKTTFLFNPPAPQVCVVALFPHDGYAPCWYLKRHTEQRIDI